MRNPAVHLVSRLGIEMKRGRERFWDSQDYVIRRSRRKGLDEASIFFRTQGCRHDAAGGCTMCDYSTGPRTSPDEMVGAVRRALDELPAGLGCVLISPSGSLLDELEVPREAREGIFDLFAASGHRELAFETRAETITAEAIRDCRDRIGACGLRIYVGLESADPWVSAYAINKALEPQAFRNAMIVLGQGHATGVANVLLGAPFLTPAEAIDDTEATVRWAFGAGAAEVCLFPCHVKRWTQLEWLHRRGEYAPPSLWSFVEVIARLGPELAPRIEIAWYTDYGAFNIIESPTTCPNCRDDVVELLSAFAADSAFDHIERLNLIDCPCRDVWRRLIQQGSPDSRIGRASRSFERIGREFMPQWWDARGPEVLLALARGAGDPL